VCRSSLPTPLILTCAATPLAHTASVGLPNATTITLVATTVTLVATTTALVTAAVARTSASPAVCLADSTVAITTTAAFAASALTDALTTTTLALSATTLTRAAAAAADATTLGITFAPTTALAASAHLPVATAPIRLPFPTALRLAVASAFCIPDATLRVTVSTATQPGATVSIASIAVAAPTNARIPGSNVATSINASRGRR